MFSIKKVAVVLCKLLINVLGDPADDIILTVTVLYIIDKPVMYNAFCILILHVPCRVVQKSKPVHFCHVMMLNALNTRLIL